MSHRLACSLQKLRIISTSRSFKLERRYLHDESQLVMGGGLEKPQGRIQEEKYFSNQNYDLMARIREQGDNFKREDHLPDWKEFEKVLNSSDGLTLLRETSTGNKHKNLSEEAFFLTEQTQCCSKLLKENQIINETDQKNRSQFKEKGSTTDLKETG